MPLLAALVLGGGMLIGYKLHDAVERQMATPEKKEPNLHALIRLLNDRYVDTLDVAHLFRDGVEGILSNLDPHTVYIPREDLSRVNEELDGHFSGIGVEFYMMDDTVTISAILPGGPCEQSGLRAGDRLLQIDGKPVAGQKLEQQAIITRIRGKEGSIVKLLAMHPDGSQLEANIKRGQIPIHSVAAASMLDGQTGYVLIQMFSEQTHAEFREALNELKRKGARRLLIDVRDNPGGYMEAVARIADELIAGDTPLITTRGRQRSETICAGEQGMFEDEPVAVLVDENSASASEILAGVIQDLDRGSVLGRRTYGKGLVQEQFDLPDGSAIRITTSRYYLPSGRCIQRSYRNGKEEYREELWNRWSHGELTNADSVHAHHQRDSFRTRKGRLVFGSEGVTPDVFLPLDTVYGKIPGRFSTERIAFRFAADYLFRQPDGLASWANADAMASGMNFSEAMLTAFSNFLSRNNMPAALSANPDAQQAVWAEWARIRFGPSGFYAVKARADRDVETARRHLLRDPR